MSSFRFLCYTDVLNRNWSADQVCRLVSAGDWAEAHAVRMTTLQVVFTFFAAATMHIQPLVAGLVEAASHPALQLRQSSDR